MATNVAGVKAAVALAKVGIDVFKAIVIYGTIQM